MWLKEVSLSSQDGVRTLETIKADKRPRDPGDDPKEAAGIVSFFTMREILVARAAAVI